MMNKFINGLVKFVDGDFTISTKRKAKPARRHTDHHEPTFKERFTQWHDEKGPAFFKAAYGIASIVICLTLITILLITASFLPESVPPGNGCSDLPVQCQTSSGSR